MDQAPSCGGWTVPQARPQTIAERLKRLGRQVSAAGAAPSRPLALQADARFNAKASMAAMIAIALCRFKLPLDRPIIAIHHASASANAAHRWSTGDFAPCAITLSRSCAAVAATRVKEASSFAVLARLIYLPRRAAISAWTLGGSR